ncbi:hypothetical protein [Pedobacter aquatilis]|uniref:hypothetical protein n=1 Tax=Pedobacter aquatilis TaxID=351343 RepID=UPI002930B697|nr:hypothetical protein [Pedobacter aquatilis]
MKKCFVHKFKAAIRLVLLVLAVLLFNYKSFSQSRVAFTPRTSQKAPGVFQGKSIYNLQGDFTMIGNTNLTLSSYSTSTDNSNSQMIYVDVDGDENTFNSSTSNFNYTVDPTCTKIIYAGLYWTGRANDNNSNTFNVSKTVNVSTAVPANSTQKLTNGSAVQYSSYTMAVSRINNSSTDRYPRYSFTGSGTTYLFEVRNSPSAGAVYVSTNNGTSWTSLSSTYTTTTSTSSATLTTPYIIADGSLNIKINSFNRYTLTNGSATNYTATADNYANVSLSGTGTSSQLITKTFDKTKVKLKKAGGTYQNITATSTDIYYPNGTDGNMYAAYADVTDYVIANGTGDYTVADIALTEGDGGSTGYYGGWGMVIIYENPSMKWRDITVFDGFGYIAGAVGAQQLAISGFQAAKNGPVNVKMGLMAGEGDRNISGDYFNIRNAANNAWIPLSHSGNSVTNFFNSSIVTGGNARNPNLDNNTGLDVSMFDLSNTNNTIIANNQTATTFQYGSTQDTYVIFNITFAVDAYIPEIQVYNANTSSIANGASVDPNQDIQFTATIYNKGTEDINNGIVKIPLPPNVYYTGSTITVGSGTVPVGGGTVTWIPPDGGINDPSVTAGGTIIWNLGTIIKPADPNTILAQLKYSIKVTNDCTILSTGGSCGLKIDLGGTFSGTGANSAISINNEFVTGYNTDCGSTPIRDPFSMNIVPSQAFLSSCPSDVVNGKKQFKAFCSAAGNVIPRSEITSAYPQGTKFYSAVPGTTGYESSLITGDFPVNPAGGSIDYYAMLPGTVNFCYLSLQTVLEVVTSAPSASDLKYCVNGGPSSFTNVTLSATGTANNYQLFYFNDRATQPLASVPSPSNVAGTTTYQVAEGIVKNGVTCFGPKKTFTVTVYPLPVITTDLTDEFYVCADETKTLAFAANNASQIDWEYFDIPTSTWMSLSNTSYPNQISVSNTGLQFSSPALSLDKITVRAKVTSANSCIVYSKAAIIEVRLCNIITNPMLPAKIIKN